MAKKGDATGVQGETPLNKIIEWPDNPRKTRDPQAIEDAGASIRAKGLIVPLILYPVPNSELFYAIDGETRRQGMNRNVDEGKCDADMMVKSITLPASTSPAQLLATALAVNTIRTEMNPIEKMEAFRDLVKSGMKPRAISEIYNLTNKEVMQHIALGSLVESARDLVRSGARHLRWAEAMTMGSPAAQEKIVAEIGANPAAYADAHSVRAALTHGTIPIESALFDPAELKDCLVTNLFTQEDGSGYFSDSEAFWKLQNAEIEKKIEELAKTYDTRVEYYNRRRFNDAGWATGGDPADSWAIVISHEDGSVEVREGMIKPAFLNDADDNGEGNWLDGAHEQFADEHEATAGQVTAKIETNPLDNATSQTSAYLTAQVIAGLRLKAASDHRVAMAFVIAASLTRHGAVASPMVIGGLPLDSRAQTADIFAMLAKRREARDRIASEAGILGVSSPAKVVSRVLALNDDALNDLFAWTVAESIATPLTETTLEVYDAVGLDVLAGWKIEETYLETLTTAQVRALATEVVELASQPSRNASISAVKRAILSSVENDALQGNWVGSTPAWQPPQVTRLRDAVTARADAEAAAAQDPALAAAA